MPPKPSPSLARNSGVSVMLRGWAVFCLAGALLSGCSESDPALEEQTMLLEAEIRKKDQRIEQIQKQLDDAREDLAEARKTAQEEPEHKLVSKEQATTLLDQEATGWRKTMNERIQDVEFTGHMLDQVVGPEEAMPFAGTLSVNFTLPSGRRGQMNLPVSGNAQGQWQMPSEQEVAGALKAMTQQQQQQARDVKNQGQGQQQAQSQPLPDDVMGANQTAVIDWGDRPKNNASQPRRSPQAQAPAPASRPQQPQQPPQQPQQQAKPTEVMPVDRDIIIDFD